MNGNKNYYLVSCVKIEIPCELKVYFLAVYSNGIEEIRRDYKHGQDIPTIIYDNE